MAESECGEQAGELVLQDLIAEMMAEEIWRLAWKKALRHANWSKKQYENLSSEQREIVKRRSKARYEREKR